MSGGGMAQETFTRKPTDRASMVNLATCHARKVDGLQVMNVYLNALFELGHILALVGHTRGVGQPCLQTADDIVPSCWTESRLFVPLANTE
jgi:hypothetical protein